MKIAWHSNAPWVPTGYGQQTATFAPRIRDLGHDVAISAFWGLGGQSIEWDGMRVYPADEKWGNRNLARIAHHHGGDEGCLVITLMDVWVLDNPGFSTLNMASWVPVDHHPLPPRVLDFFQRSGSRPIAMSRFGERMLAEQGLDPLYVPHGIDTTVFRPRLDVRDEVRDLVGLPQDAFVVGMVAANKGVAPPRKAFPQVFQAFAELRESHPDAYLYLHTDVTPNTGGINLGRLAAACGIPADAIKYTPQWQLELGIEPSDLACIYSAFDVLANPSYGEGFGIPIVEAQACGVPVIVTDHSSMRELCGAGWLVDGDPWYDATQGAFFKSPSVADIADAMRQAYDNRGAADIGVKAREFAAGYDADLVTRQFWVPALAELADPPTRTRSAPQDPAETRRVLDGLSGRLAFDIGANTGMVARDLADRCERVIAAEPAVESFQALQRRAPGNVTALNIAVSDHDGTVELLEQQNPIQTGQLTSGVCEDWGPVVARRTVPCRTVDSLTDEFGAPDVIKVDTEGHEAQVIRGALRTLRDHRPVLFVEVHDATQGDEITGLLADLYDIERVANPTYRAGEWGHDNHYWLHAVARTPAEAVT